MSEFPEQEDVKKTSPVWAGHEANLERFPDLELTVEEVTNIVEQVKPELIEGIGRNCYWLIKGTLPGDRRMPYRLDDELAMFLPQQGSKFVADGYVFLGQANSVLDANRSQLPRVHMVYGINPVAAETFNTFPYDELYMGPDDLVCLDIFVDAKDKSPINGSQASRLARKNEYDGITVRSADLLKQLRWLMKPEEDYSHSRKTLERLADELGIEDQEELDRLARAIQEYGNHHASWQEDNGDAWIKDCGIETDEFYHFAKYKWRVNLDSAFIGTNSREAEWAHKFNVYKGKIAIDWTARQFGVKDREQYPLIRPLKDWFDPSLDEGGKSYSRIRNVYE